MESKIFIDINYASREPQIAIIPVDTDDPRDKLVSMFTGHAMPGVKDGFCRIERVDGRIIITPIHPLDILKYIPIMRDLAELNPAIDTSGMREFYLEILQSELGRIMAVDSPSLLPLFEQLLKPVRQE